MHRQTVGRADGRDRPELAVVEEPGDFRLRRQAGVPAQDVLHDAKFHVVGARDDG